MTWTTLAYGRVGQKRTGWRIVTIKAAGSEMNFELNFSHEWVMGQVERRGQLAIAVVALNPLFYSSAAASSIKVAPRSGDWLILHVFCRPD